jgi:pimeloyl-ACP methyl ester carboxylesterase
MGHDDGDSGLPLYYEDEGEGKPLLLLHGWAANADSSFRWRGFSRRSPRDRMDFPGTARRRNRRAWSVTEYMEMTRAFMDKLGIDGCDFVAHSFGGRVALLLAATYRKRSGGCCSRDARGCCQKDGEEADALLSV